ncbi:MAG: hypothetical protein U0441_17540 [Polyangiaceae bacterium]
MSDDKPTLDPGVRDLVADLLYSHLPALYRVADMAEGAKEPQKSAAPRGVEELYKFVRVLAAPIARTRQNVEELHADLFIDKGADWVLPYLAEMIGMRLVFPDAPSNRRDVRGTVGWRRRKGTPAMLQEMASDLSGQMAVTEEGWKRILLAQDLNMRRPERTIALLRPAVIAERATGPLDASFHSVDPRRISPFTGIYHPKHVAHWWYPTQLFPLHNGTAFERTLYDAGEPAVDYRFAFHPQGAEAALRLRRATTDDPLATDRVPPLHFAARPGDYFDQSGAAGAEDGTSNEDGASDARFTVRFLGLPAAVAAPVKEPRAPSQLPADAALASGKCDVLLLAHTAERLTAPVRVDVMAVPLTGVDANVPNTAAAVSRGHIEIRPGGGVATIGSGAAVPGPFAVMLRLTVPSGAGYFPGATIEIACQSNEAALPCSDARLATMGFLSGALAVELPATWIATERWLFVAADGSTFDADPPGTKLTKTLAGLRVPGEVLSVGPGPAWPPLPLRAEPEMFRGVPAALARGPVVVHQPRALDVSGAPAPVGNAVDVRLVFAAHIFDPDANQKLDRPFLRLEWKGPDATGATTFSARRKDGTPVANVGELRAAWQSIAEAAALSPDDVELRVRLESSALDVLLPPCEVAFTSDRGESVLIHLPALRTKAGVPAPWTSPGQRASDIVSVSVDGSTFWAGTLQVARLSAGPILPLREAKTLRRRQVRQRTLCWWKNEDPASPQVGLATPKGYLDIDPTHGLFAFAASEPAPTATLASVVSPTAGWPAAPVTVDFLEGYSYSIGARPDAREPVLGAELPEPTRVVTGGGSLHADAPVLLQGLPRYATLGAALQAIDSDPHAAAHEVVQIEDSATYSEPSLLFPKNTKVKQLTIQAAELERPVLVLRADWKPAGALTYDAITLRGLVLQATTFSGAPPVPSTAAIQLPPAKAVHLQLCSAAHARDLWSFTSVSGADTNIEIFRCLTGKLSVSGASSVVITESVIDAANGPAVIAIDSEVRFDRCTVAADRADLAGAFAVDVRVMECSESLFTELARARDRFHGCVRYSRVEPESELPRRHRVTEDVALFVTRDRSDPAHYRLADACPRTVSRGAEDGSEMGAFHGARLAQRGDALFTRLVEYTPAGLSTGLLRLD